MKRLEIQSILVVLFFIAALVIPVSAQVERTLNPDLLPILYHIDDGDWHVMGSGFRSIDDDVFQITIRIDTNIQTEIKDIFDVSTGPWNTRFQVWVDGQQLHDDDSGLSYSKTLTMTDYGDVAVVKVRAEGYYFKEDSSDTTLIYNEREISFDFSPRPNYAIPYLLLLIGCVAVVIVVGAVVVRRRRKNRVVPKIE